MLQTVTQTTIKPKLPNPYCKKNLSNTHNDHEDDAVNLPS